MERYQLEYHRERRLEYWGRFHAEKETLYKKQIIQGCFIAIGIFFMPFIVLFALLLITGKTV
jgi:hypothetical protein